MHLLQDQHRHLSIIVLNFICAWMLSKNGTEKSQPVHPVLPNLLQWGPLKMGCHPGRGQMQCKSMALLLVFQFCVKLELPHINTEQCVDNCLSSRQAVWSDSISGIPLLAERSKPPGTGSHYSLMPLASCPGRAVTSLPWLQEIQLILYLLSCFLGGIM